MIQDDQAVNLHHRAALGETLSDEENALLQAWYKQQDALEAAELSRDTSPSIAELEESIRVLEQRLAKTIERNQELAARNEALRAEIAIIRQRLKQPLPALAA